MRKKAVNAILLSLCAVTVLYVTAPVFLRMAVERSLRRSFPQSKVSISSCGFLWLRGVALKGIVVQRAPWYSLRAREVDAIVSPQGLARGRIDACVVKGAQVELTASRVPSQRLGIFLSLSGPGPGPAFSLGTLQVEGAAVSARTADMRLQGRFSCIVDIQPLAVRSLDAQVDAFDGWGTTLQGARLHAAAGSPGEVSLEKGTVQKAVVRGLKGTVEVRGDTLSVPSFSMRLLEGEVSGTAAVSLAAKPKYTARLRASNLSLAALVKDFAWEEKFMMQGRLSGEVRAGGDIPGYPMVAGGFLAQDPGGTLVIRDKPTLSAIAKSNSLPLEIAVENFKDYRYNKGTVKLAGRSGEIGVQVNLDSPQGKFDYKLTYRLLPEEGGKKP